jgi:HD-like signal output (HDOD) protein
MRKSILIVDDEPQVQNTLRQWLVASAPDWRVELSASGMDALHKMAKCQFDAIIADLSLTGMDGIELLGEVRMHHPGTARIIMCRQNERQALQSAFGLAHQYIFKPCKLERLMEALSSVVNRNSIGNENIKKLLGQIKSIPSLPSNYVDLKKEAQSENASLHNVAAIIQRDPAMLAKILQLVNSVQYGLSQQVSNIQEAVMYLGLETIQSLFLSLHLFSYFQRTQIKSCQLANLWNHSWKTATLARQMALAVGVRAHTVEESFTAGILHDLGKLVLAGGMADSYKMTIAKASEERISEIEAEKAVFHCTHAEVGSYLLGLWGIATPIVDAVHYHHIPLQANHLDIHALTVVHVANFLSHLHTDADQAIINSGIDLDYLASVNCLEHLETWQDIYREVEQRAGKRSGAAVA